MIYFSIQYRNPTAYRGGRGPVETTTEDDNLLSRRERHLEDAEKSWLRKFKLVLRPFEVMMGIMFFILAFLVFISLLMTK